jgi:hypothetical protein
MSENQEQTVQKVYDKIVILDTGVTLIGQVVDDDKYKQSDMLCIYKPMEVFDNVETGEIFLRDFIPYSSDLYYFVGVRRVLTLANPDEMILENYLQAIQESLAEVEETSNATEQVQVYH